MVKVNRFVSQQFTSFKCIFLMYCMIIFRNIKSSYPTNKIRVERQSYRLQGEETNKLPGGVEIPFKI